MASLLSTVPARRNVDPFPALRRDPNAGDEEAPETDLARWMLNEAPE